MRWLIIILFGIFLFVSLVEAKQIETIVTVTVNPIYNLSVDINILNKFISEGENLSVFVDLQKVNLTSISNEVSVDLNYQVLKDTKKRKIVEAGFVKVINVTDSKQDTVNITVTSDLSGVYILNIIASNPQSFSGDDEDEFHVRKSKKPVRSFLHFIFGVLSR